MFTSESVTLAAPRQVFCGLSSIFKTSLHIFLVYVLVHVMPLQLFVSYDFSFVVVSFLSNHVLYHWRKHFCANAEITWNVEIIERNKEYSVSYWPVLTVNVLLSFLLLLRVQLRREDVQLENVQLWKFLHTFGLLWLTLLFLYCQ